jgi:hypothetical protein
VPGAESVVYEARLEGKLVAAKKPKLSTSADLDRFHEELQILRSARSFVLFSSSCSSCSSLMLQGMNVQQPQKQLCSFFLFFF